jgi:ADP-ribose pyrophosphatase
MKSLPNIRVVPIEKEVPANAKDFLTVKKKWYEINYPDNSKAEILYDVVDRRYNDAVTIVVYAEIDEEIFVYLRSCVRPPLARWSVLAAGQWELAAGLIDPGETPAQAASRECLEELGFNIPAQQYSPLGDFILPSAGMSAERIYFYCAKVNPEERINPTSDGSPLEKDGEVILVSLKEAIKEIDTGNMKDAKTEIGLRRLLSAC